VKRAKKRSNCLAYAIRKLKTHGGHIVITPSKHGWWYHFAWTPSIEGLKLEQYIPKNPIELDDLPKIIQKIPLHIMIYEGKIVDENEIEIVILDD
jgi:hypothetical protein